jgi:hypothetical protein
MFSKVREGVKRPRKHRTHGAQSIFNNSTPKERRSPPNDRDLEKHDLVKVKSETEEAAAKSKAGQQLCSVRSDAEQQCSRPMPVNNAAANFAFNKLRFWD